jgi:hypothetical protein
MVEIFYACKYNACPYDFDENQIHLLKTILDKFLLNLYWSRKVCSVNFLILTSAIWFNCLPVFL